MSSPDPGWYDDPTEPNLLRYWNGTSWTSHRMPIPTNIPENADNWETSPGWPEESKNLDAPSPLDQSRAISPPTEAPAAEAPAAEDPAGEDPAGEDPASEASRFTDEPELPHDIADRPEAAAKPEPQSEPEADEAELVPAVTETEPDAAPLAPVVPAPVTPAPTPPEQPLRGPKPAALAAAQTASATDPEAAPTVQEALAPTSHYETDRKRAIALIGAGLLGLLLILGLFFLSGRGDDTESTATATATPVTEPEPAPTAVFVEPTALPTATPPPTPSPTPTATPAPLPDPFADAVAAVSPALVSIEAVGCGVVARGSGVLLATGSALTSQPVVTLSERVSLKGTDNYTLGVYLGVNEESVAILSTAIAPDGTLATATPQLEDEVMLVWRAPDGEIHQRLGTVTATREATFDITTKDASTVLGSFSWGAVVITADGELVGVVRSADGNTAVVSNLSANALDIDIPEGPRCGDSEAIPAPPTLDEALQLGDTRLRELAIAQVLTSALTQGQWDDVRRLDSSLRELDDDQLEFLFGTWHHAVPIPLNDQRGSIRLGLIVQIQASDGSTSTILDCVTWRITDDNLVEPEPDDQPQVILSADTWLDTGSQRSKATELC